MPGEDVSSFVNVFLMKIKIAFICLDCVEREDVKVVGTNLSLTRILVAKIGGLNRAVNVRGPQHNL